MFYFSFFHSSVSLYCNKENKNLGDSDLFSAIEISFRGDTRWYFQDARMILTSTACKWLQKRKWLQKIGEGGRLPLKFSKLRFSKSKKLVSSPDFEESGLVEKHLFPEVLQNRCSDKFRNIYRKGLVFESLFNKVAGLQANIFYNTPSGCFSPSILIAFLNIHGTSLNHESR